MSDQLQVGDWVNSYSKGIWQIYRILPHSGSKISIFSKRFLSGAMKRSFSEECCDATFVKKLDSETMAKLEVFLEENQALYQEFIEYKPKPLHSIFNARFGIPSDKSAEEIAASIQKDKMLWAGQIAPLLESLGLDTKKMPYWTAQFVSPDHTCIDGYLAYRFERILKY